MSEPSEDVAARGRAIFKRLRAQGPNVDPDEDLLAGESPDATESLVEDESGGGREDACSMSPTWTEDARRSWAEVGTVAHLPRRGRGPRDPLPASRTSPSMPLRSPLIRTTPAAPRPLRRPSPRSRAQPLVVRPPGQLTSRWTCSRLLPGIPSPAASAITPEVLADPTAVPAVDHTGRGRGGARARSPGRSPGVMAIANQKGGVGKTTTAVNLGACLADIGYRVLVVDLDPQGNASTGMGINIRDLQGSMYDVVLHDLPIEDCVEATSVREPVRAPRPSLELAGAEIELVPAFSREMRLKRALDEVHDDYDFVFIDRPPSPGLLTVNGLALPPARWSCRIQCEYYALEGFGQLLRNVTLVQKNLNQALEVSAIVLVMYDARTKLADQVATEVREHFGDKVCRQRGAQDRCGCPRHRRSGSRSSRSTRPRAGPSPTASSRRR